MAGKALSNQMTRTVRVNRIKLLETLKSNREQHIAVFNEAMDGYKELALAKVEDAFIGLDRRLANRKKEMIEHIQSFTAETASKFSDYFVILEQVVVNLKLPVSYAEAYDAAIDMAMFDTREELDLSGAEFQCFCRDVWDWTYEFSNTNATYTGLSKGGR